MVLRAAVADWRRAGLVVGFVPTMGALHDGHGSLIRAARAECDRVVVSVFVNPLQFGPNEDLAHYPRTLDADVALAGEAGADAVFVPAVSEMYPDGFQTTVSVAGLSEGLCGASRPGHFDGVTTVVARLFGMVGPDRAYFGQKDYQQVAVIRRMVCDLAIPVAVVACPIIRDVDGLAMSSRNRYLGAALREKALAVPAALTGAEAAYRAGEVDAEVLLKTMVETVSAVGGRVDYVAAVDPDDLSPLVRVRAGSVLLVAAWIGEIRLIDNRILP
jgi:pantoate--beta-alanine ligase